MKKKGKTHVKGLSLALTLSLMISAFSGGMQVWGADVQDPETETIVTESMQEPGSENLSDPEQESLTEEEQADAGQNVTQKSEQTENDQSENANADYDVSRKSEQAGNDLNGGTRDEETQNEETQNSEILNEEIQNEDIQNEEIHFVEEQRLETEGDETIDSDELFEQYARKLFYDGEDAADGSSKKMLRKARSTGDRLQGQNKIVYDALKEAAIQIANGERESSTVVISFSDLGVDPDKHYTKEELGLDYLYDPETKTWNPDITAAMMKVFDIDVALVRQCLKADYPYEFYWQYGGFSYPASCGVQYNSREAWFYQDEYTIDMPVEQKYRKDGQMYVADTEITGAAAGAVRTAKQIVEDAKGKSDYEKLLYYKERICSLVVYDYDSANNSGSIADRGAWALIYVFDGDDDTNVVCEGYSEAFQYLCDITQFDDSRVCAYCVTGIMYSKNSSGPHKWNIIHMEDGYNYLADITNSDEDSIGQAGGLFMNGATGSVQDKYTCEWSEKRVEEQEDDGSITIWTYPAGSLSYSYDDETLNLFSLDELTLSEKAYGENVPVDTDTVARISSLDLFLTDKIGMRVYVDVNRSYVSDNDYMRFSYNDKTVEQKVSEASLRTMGGTEYYVFELPLTTKQMTDPVTFEMFVNGNGGREVTYTVRKYAQIILQSTHYSDSLKNLVRAMLNYGGYAQIYDSYRLDDPANAGVYENDPVQGAIPNMEAYTHEVNRAEDTQGFNLKSASLNLGTDISLRYYYTLQEGKTESDYSFNINTDKTLEYGYDSSMKANYVMINHISPGNLGKMFKLTVSPRGSNTPVTEINFGPLSYCRLMAGREGVSEKLSDLCIAIYYYYMAASQL